MKVTVDVYNPIWAQQFQQVKAELQKYLEGVNIVSIEHVGSTSVPGLAAKPVLDIDVVVTPDNLEPSKAALVKKGGYTYFGTWGIPNRHALRRAAEFPARNLYVCIEGCMSLQNHLLLRDICRRDSALRELYGQKKLELAQMDWANVDEYCEAKNDIIQLILEKAGMEARDLEEIRQRNTLAQR